MKDLAEIAKAILLMIFGIVFMAGYILLFGEFPLETAVGTIGILLLIVAVDYVHRKIKGKPNK